MAAIIEAYFWIWFLALVALGYRFYAKLPDEPTVDVDHFPDANYPDDRINEARFSMLEQLRDQLVDDGLSVYVQLSSTGVCVRTLDGRIQVHTVVTWREGNPTLWYQLFVGDIAYPMMLWSDQVIEAIDTWRSDKAWQ